MIGSIISLSWLIFRNNKLSKATAKLWVLFNMNVPKVDAQFVTPDINLEAPLTRLSVPKLTETPTGLVETQFMLKIILAIIIAYVIRYIVCILIAKVCKRLVQWYRGEFSQKSFRTNLCLHLINDEDHLTLPFGSVPFPMTDISDVKPPSLLNVDMTTGTIQGMISINWDGYLSYVTSNVKYSLHLPKTIHIPYALIKPSKQMLKHLSNLQMYLVRLEPNSLLSPLQFGNKPSPIPAVNPKTKGLTKSQSFRSNLSGHSSVIYAEIPHENNNSQNGKVKPIYTGSSPESYEDKYEDMSGDKYEEMSGTKYEDMSKVEYINTSELTH